MFQSEACGERSTSKSSPNGVWQGEMFHMHSSGVDSVVCLVKRHVDSIFHLFLFSDTARCAGDNRKSRDQRPAR